MAGVGGRALWRLLPLSAAADDCDDNISRTLSAKDAPFLSVDNANDTDMPPWPVVLPWLKGFSPSEGRMNSSSPWAMLRLRVASFCFANASGLVVLLICEQGD